MREDVAPVERGAGAAVNGAATSFTWSGHGRWQQAAAETPGEARRRPRANRRRGETDAVGDACTVTIGGEIDEEAGLFASRAALGFSGDSGFLHCVRSERRRERKGESVGGSGGGK